MYHNKVTQATQEHTKIKINDTSTQQTRSKGSFQTQPSLGFPLSLCLSLSQQHNKQEAKVPFQIQPSLGFSSLSLSLSLSLSTTQQTRSKGSFSNST